MIGLQLLQGIGDLPDGFRMIDQTGDAITVEIAPWVWEIPLGSARPTPANARRPDNRTRTDYQALARSWGSQPNVNGGVVRARTGTGEQRHQFISAR
jgi:hypothetical protein